ncbi:MAG TPA: hypothetical protein PK431_00420 [Chitinophagales bacterium]|nr:hypothetical protein [Chitinophagales bacterium]
MKKLISISLFIVIVIVSLTVTNACYYDKEDILYPEQPCDTSKTVSYSNDVVPILSVNCYNCHSLVNAPVYGENLILEGYVNLRTYMLLEPETLENSINQNGKALNMPRGAAKLAKCSISDIEIWVKQGARNN